MSLVFHGVIFRSSEAAARSHFTSLNSTLPLRLVQLDDGVFGIYAKEMVMRQVSCSGSPPSCHRQKESHCSIGTTVVSVPGSNCTRTAR